MIYCQEPRKVQYLRVKDDFYATSDGRVIENPPDGREVSYAIEKGRYKARIGTEKLDLAKLIVSSFTKHRPEAENIGFKDGDPSNCALGNLLIYEEGELRRKPDEIEVVSNGRRKIYFSKQEACHCECISTDQINYILQSPSKEKMMARCQTLGIVSIRRINK